MTKASMIPGKGMIRGKPNPRHQTLGERLKVAREAADIKPVHLSLAAGLSRDTVLRIEDEGRVPGVDTIERLARVLKVSPGWLAFAPLRAPMEPTARIEEGKPLACLSMGERLRGMREARGMTKRAVGEAAGISGQAVADIEGGRMPGADTVEALAGGLGVSPAWLAFGEDPQIVPRAPRSRRKVKTTPPAERRRRKGSRPAKGSGSSARPAR